MLTVLEVIRKTSEFFASKGIDSPRLNAELLVGHALGLPRMRLYLEFERPLDDTQIASIRELVRRRGKREPLQHILGFSEFCGLRLKVDRRALIPRPETEYLIEVASPRIAAGARDLLDLGTGSGAIALALASAFSGANVDAVDASPEALSLARENAESLGLATRVRFLQGDWFGPLASESYDAIFSNPPYLTGQEVAESEPEVREHDPRSALVAEDDGLADLRKILLGARGRLKAGGMLALETGIAHHERLAALAKEAGYASTMSARDLAGRDRYFLAWV